jgi:tetratricopeptide (TPR) repeat protein
MTVLALASVASAVVYQAAARQRDYRALLARGDAALRDDQTFTAIEAYSGAIALRPDAMLAHLRLAETYERRGNLDEAARELRTAARLDPTATRPLEELGDVLYQQQRFDRSADAYDRCFRLDDRSARVAYKLALARYRDGRTDVALQAVNQSIALDGRSPDAYYLLGICLRAERRLVDAQHAFERAVSVAPGMIEAREELAGVFGALDRRAEELQQLQVLAGLDRRHVDRQVAVGREHARAGRWELAIVTLGNALEQAPNEPQIYRALGEVWLERARGDRALLKKAREALERIASNPAAASDTLTLYGRALLQDGDVETAGRVLQQATARFPVEPDAFLQYADAAERLNHFSDARTALIQYGGLVANEPSPAIRAARIATLSLKISDFTTASEWFQRASSANPADVRLIASLADAQLRAGNRVAAQETVGRGLDKDPSNQALLNLKQKIEKSKSN